MDSQQQKRRRVTRSHGCTNRLAWLQAMDPDAFKVLMTSYVIPHAVFRVVLRDIPRPARFMSTLKEHFAYLTRIGMDPDQFELSRYYVHYLKPHLRNEPKCDRIEFLTDSAHARICGLRLTTGGYMYSYARGDQKLWPVHHIDLCKRQVAAAATRHGISIRQSWTKRRIWQEMMRAGC